MFVPTHSCDGTPVDWPPDHRFKLWRARDHLNHLDQRTKQIIQGQGWSVVRELDRDSGKDVWKVRANPMTFQEFGVRIGDVLHNLRSSLDHLAYALAVAYSGRPERPEDVEFPIHWEPKSFDRVRGREIGLVHPDAQAIVERMQPYNRPDPRGDLLWILHELSNWDKHRALHVTPYFGEEASVRNDVVSGVEILDVKTFPMGRAFEDEAVVIETTFRTTGDDPQMYVQVDQALAIRFSDPDGPAGDRQVVPLLTDMIRKIEFEVFGELERFLA